MNAATTVVQKQQQQGTKKNAIHPPFEKMIMTAIQKLNERGGSSRQAIKKYIVSNFKVDETKVTSQLNLALRRGSDKGVFILPKGPSGTVKVTKKEEKKKTKKVMKKKPSSPTKKKLAPPKKTTSSSSSSSDEKKKIIPKKSNVKPSLIKPNPTKLVTMVKKAAEGVKTKLKSATKVLSPSAKKKTPQNKVTKKMTSTKKSSSSPSKKKPIGKANVKVVGGGNSKKPKKGSSSKLTKST